MTRVNVMLLLLALVVHRAFFSARHAIRVAPRVMWSWIKRNTDERAS